MPRALPDVGRLYRFLDRKRPEAARRSAAIILKSADPLEYFPALGTPVPDEPGFREIYTNFGHSAYMIRYMIDQTGTVLVTQVWHGKDQNRKP